MYFASEVFWSPTLQVPHLLVATQRFFMFTPILGEMIEFDEHIFEMGWNHQLGFRKLIRLDVKT